MVNDTVSDTLTRIKNGFMAGRKTVQLPKTKMIAAMCELLVKNGYLAGVGEKDLMLEVELKYEEKLPKLTDLKRVSKPGRRVYANKNHLPKVLGGKGLAIISTPLGLLSDRDARKKGVGGEVICEIW